MISSFRSSSSGIRAAFSILEVSAGNTANMDTDGYRKNTALLAEGQDGGVAVNIQKTNSPGPVYAAATGAAVEGSNVTFSDEVLSMIKAKNMLGANAAVFKTADEMETSLIDILA